MQLKQGHYWELALLISIVPPFAIAPVLIIVGMLMLEEIVNINFKDFMELFSSFFVIMLIPLTFSITQGIAIGFTVYGIMSIITGRRKQLHPVMYILVVLFIVQFAFFKNN